MSHCYPSEQNFGQTGRTDGKCRVTELLPKSELDPDSGIPFQALASLSLEGDGEQSLDLDFSKLRLDSATPTEPTAGLILYPKSLGLEISPYGRYRCYDSWAQVKLDNGSEQSESIQVFVVASNAEQFGCTITHDNVLFYLLFDCAKDRLVLDNCSNQDLDTWFDKEFVRVCSGEITTLSPGSWTIGINGRTLIDLQVLQRTSSRFSAPLSTKRSAPESHPPQPKRMRLGESLYRRIETSQGLQANLAENALVKLGKGATMHINSDGGGYWFTQHVSVADQPLSKEWQMEQSRRSGKVIAVQVIKNGRTNEHEMLRIMNVWKREVTSHSSHKIHVCAIVSFPWVAKLTRASGRDPSDTQLWPSVS